MPSQEWADQSERIETTDPLPEKGRTIMAAMKPRTGDGPLEVAEESRSLIMRVPLEGGGRLVVEISADEARELRDALNTVVPA